MKILRVKTSKVPSNKEKAELLQFMRTEGFGQVVLVNQETGEETVLELEHRDADGRSLLQD